WVLLVGVALIDTVIPAFFHPLLGVTVPPVPAVIVTTQAGESVHMPPGERLGPMPCSRRATKRRPVWGAGCPSDVLVFIGSSKIARAETLHFCGNMHYPRCRR